MGENVTTDYASFGSVNRFHAFQEVAHFLQVNDCLRVNVLGKQKIVVVCEVLVEHLIAHTGDNSLLLLGISIRYLIVGYKFIYAVFGSSIHIQVEHLHHLAAVLHCENVGGSAGNGDSLLEYDAVIQQGVEYSQKYGISLSVVLREERLLQNQVTSCIICDYDVSSVVHYLATGRRYFTLEGQRTWAVFKRFIYSLAAYHLNFHQLYSRQNGQEQHHTYDKYRFYGISYSSHYSLLYAGNRPFVERFFVCCQFVVFIASSIVRCALGIRKWFISFTKR